MRIPSNLSDDRPTLVVGVITRGRPLMLVRCLNSLAQVRCPGGIGRLMFAVVENEVTLSIQAELDALALATGREVLSAPEATPGIPAARNRVLDLALTAGADHLAFLDDDERADPDWLCALFAVHAQNGHDLTGGPVQVGSRTDAALSARERLVLNGLQVRAEHVARKAAARQHSGPSGAVTVVTSNWLVRLAFLRRTGVRFDATLGLSGGSDTLFFRDVRAAGGVTGWASNAYVTEDIPRSRLTFAYQFCRGRDQTLASARTRGLPTGLRGAPKAVAFALLKALLGLVRTLLAPFTRGRSLVLAARAFGAAWGRLCALGTQNSTHYAHVHGR